MANTNQRFTDKIMCLHCRNKAPMEIVSDYSQVKSPYDREGNPTHDSGEVYELLLCPACNAVTLRNYFWHEYMDADDIEEKILYPTASKTPLGLPIEIADAVEAASKVKTIDANAYVVLIGRVLEMVCENRMANGNTLANKLNDLAKRAEIPEKLVSVAHGLRNLRNIGAHAVLGELTKSEIPIVEDLCNAVLEYVYSAPFLAQQAEDKLRHIKTKKENHKS
jgi:hypothetical protein